MPDLGLEMGLVSRDHWDGSLSYGSKCVIL